MKFFDLLLVTLAQGKKRPVREYAQKECWLAIVLQDIVDALSEKSAGAKLTNQKQPTTFDTSFKPGECGVPSIHHNPYTFTNLPKYRRRRNEFSDEGKSEKPKKFQLMQQRIVGGAQSTPHSWPWQVYVDFVRFEFF